MDGAPPARRSRGTDAPKDDSQLRPHIWPGLALAGGVVIAAIVVLLVVGGGGGAGNANLPPGTGAGDTRLFPHPARRAPARPESDAAATQYGAQGTRGSVLGDP
jgi:hypothetical protein